MSQTHEEYLDDKRSEAQWDHAYADDSDRMEREEEARLEAAYEEAKKEEDALNEAYREADEEEYPCWENDVEYLISVCGEVLKSMDKKHPLYEKLSNALENVYEWGDTNDPRAMGWVDDKGRP